MAKRPVDQLLPNAEVTWFTDGSGYLVKEQHKARATIVNRSQVVWVEPLSPRTSA